MWLASSGGGRAAGGVRIVELKADEPDTDRLAGAATDSARLASSIMSASLELRESRWASMSSSSSSSSAVGPWKGGWGKSASSADEEGGGGEDGR